MPTERSGRNFFSQSNSKGSTRRPSDKKLRRPFRKRRRFFRVDRVLRATSGYEFFSPTRFPSTESVWNPARNTRVSDRLERAVDNDVNKYNSALVHARPAPAKSRIRSIVLGGLGFDRIDRLGFDWLRTRNAKTKFGVKTQKVNDVLEVEKSGRCGACRKTFDDGNIVRNYDNEIKSSRKHAANFAGKVYRYTIDGIYTLIDTDGEKQTPQKKKKKMIECRVDFFFLQKHFYSHSALYHSTYNNGKI